MSCDNPGGYRRPPAVVHVDLDGAADIFAAHGWAYPHRTDSLFETGMRNILGLFERNGIHATLFTIANSLDDPRKLELVREAAANGHEIASHTLTHRNLLRLTRSEKQREVAGSREKIEKLVPVRIAGFRAPGYQIDRECLELLSDNGYEYDSSAFPTQGFAQRLGVPVGSLMKPARLLDGSSLLEMPLPDYRPFPFPFNPTYSLLVGKRYFQLGIRRCRARNSPLVLLFHLTDLAEPMLPSQLNGFLSRLFTLSLVSAARKLRECQRMLDLVGNEYEITTTSHLIKSFHKQKSAVV